MRLASQLLFQEDLALEMKNADGLLDVLKIQTASLKLVKIGDLFQTERKSVRQRLRTLGISVQA